MSKKDDTNLDKSPQSPKNNKNDNSSATTTTSTSSVSDLVDNEQTLGSASYLNSKDENSTTESSHGPTTNDSFDSTSNNQNDTSANEPYVQDSIYSNTNQANRGLTGNYFCFDCGAIMTTIEDKNQHILIEEERHKNQEDSEH